MRFFAVVLKSGFRASRRLGCRALSQQAGRQSVAATRQQVSVLAKFGAVSGVAALFAFLNDNNDDFRAPHITTIDWQGALSLVFPQTSLAFAAGCPLGHDGAPSADADAYHCDRATNRFMSSVPRGPRPRRNYAEYLNLYYLLDIQRDDENISSDEQHFITVHQIFELWFKLVIRELTECRDILVAGFVPEQDVPRLVHKLTRCTKIFSLLSQQWKVVETLAPQDFLAFRNRLGTASGFESFQIRELEMLLGLKQSSRSREMNPVEHFKRMRDNGGEPDEIVYNRIRSIANSVTIDDALKIWLSRTPIYGSLPGEANDASVVERFVDRYLKAFEDSGNEALQQYIANGDMERVAEIQERTKRAQDTAEAWLRPNGKIDRSRAGLLFIESHRELPMLAWPRQLLDAIAELEQSMLLFRFCHARMVERIIGRRTGTGGSSGVAYLDQTTGYRIFHDLWTVRSLLIRREIVPHMDSRAAERFYQFQGDTTQ